MTWVSSKGMRPPGSKVTTVTCMSWRRSVGVDEAGGGPAALGVGHRRGGDVALVEDEGVGGGDALDGLVALADPVEADRRVGVVAELSRGRRAGGRRSCRGSRAWVAPAMVRVAPPSTTKRTPSAAGSGSGVVAAAAGGDLHDVLREGLGEAGQRAGDDPGAGRLPVREVAGHDVGIDPARDHRVGLGEDGAAGVEVGLAGQAALRGVVARRGCGGRPSWQHVLETEEGDALDLGAGGGELLVAVVGDAGLEGLQDARLVEAAHGDDEGEAELRLVGVVELGEAGALGVGEGVEAGAGLLGGGFGGQAFRRRQLAGEVGVGLEDGEALLRAGGAEGAGEGVGEAGGGVVGGAELEVEGALGDPGGVLEDAAVALDEGVLRERGGALGDGRGRVAGCASGRRCRRGWRSRRRAWPGCGRGSRRGP